ncbi:MAG: metallophosphoesterase [Nocardioides sp.]
MALACAAAVSLGSGLLHRGSPELPRTPLPAVSAATTTRIAVAGDTGTGADSAIEGTVKSIVEQDRQHGYDGLVLLGDLVYPDGEAEQAPERVTDVFEPITSHGARLIPVLGNHDYLSDEQTDLLLQLGRQKSWYADQVGIARIVVLDTEQVDNPAQTAWLADTLASPTTADWTIIAMHKPAYSAGYHGSEQQIQQLWVPLFERYEVPLVLSGHDHDYQRSRLIDGVTYVVSGGAATLRPTGHQDFTAASTSTLHYVDLLLEPDRLTLRAIDRNGMQFDSVELER